MLQNALSTNPIKQSTSPQNNLSQLQVTEFLTHALHGSACPRLVFARTEGISKFQINHVWNASS